MESTGPESFKNVEKYMKTEILANGFAKAIKCIHDDGIKRNLCS